MRRRRDPLTGAAQLRQLSSIRTIDCRGLLRFLICCGSLLLLLSAVSLLLNGVQLIECARRVGVHDGGRRRRTVGGRRVSSVGVGAMQKQQ